MNAQTRTPEFQNNDLLWYCVKVRPKQEQLTARSLRTDVHLEVFAPSLRFQRSRGKGKMWVSEALFPGYVFARFQFCDAIRHVRATRGVANVVGFGGVPSVLADNVISDLRIFVTEEEMVTVPAEVVLGDEVSLVSGVFSGIRAVVTRVLTARQRIAILLDFLGEVREIEVSLADVLLDRVHPLSTNAAR